MDIFRPVFHAFSMFRSFHIVTFCDVLTRESPGAARTANVGILGERGESARKACARANGGRRGDSWAAGGGSRRRAGRPEAGSWATITRNGPCLAGRPSERLPFRFRFPPTPGRCAGTGTGTRMHPPGRIAGRATAGAGCPPAASITVQLVQHSADSRIACGNALPARCPRYQRPRAAALTACGRNPLPLPPSLGVRGGNGFR